MNRLDDIAMRIVNKAPQIVEQAAGMNIPGMRIGTAIAPGAPSFEDVSWLVWKVKECMEYLQKIDEPGARDLIQRIVRGA